MRLLVIILQMQVTFHQIATKNSVLSTFEDFLNRPLMFRYHVIQPLFAFTNFLASFNCL